MIRPLQIRRLWAMALLLTAAFAGLGYRLVDLQVLRHDELRQEALANIQQAFFREPRRGDIRDIKGNLLADSKLVKTVCADPTFICNPQVGNRQIEIARFLAPYLHLDEAELVRLFQLRVLTNRNGKPVFDQHVVLKRKVRVEDWQQIHTNLAQLSFGVNEKALSSTKRLYYESLRNRGIFTEDDQLREYPNQCQAADVVGFVGWEEIKTSHGRLIETSGREGLELTLNEVLKGVRGWRLTELDKTRRELVAFREQDIAPRSGLNAVITLDLGLQNILETELAEGLKAHQPVSICGVIVRPKTGEILAMATLPCFNPNDPNACPVDHRRNRVVCDQWEPGSTFKIVVVSAALNEHVVTLDEVFNCENGRFYYAGYPLTDHARYGLLTVEQIIARSSNIGAAKVGIKLGSERLYQYVRQFGFGTPTGIPLPGERTGTVYPLNRWTKLSISRIPMGYEVAVTPLQMIMAMCAIANGGHLMKPMLVDHLEDEQGHVVVQYRPQAVRDVCSEETARLMAKALKAVMATNGTAYTARLDNYAVAGKTGTAKKSDGHSYPPGKYFSSFIGFFPADNPEICISVVMDEPRAELGYYGSATAAPIFHNIAQRAANYLSIRPDFLTVDGPTVTAKMGHLTPTPPD